MNRDNLRNGYFEIDTEAAAWKRSRDAATGARRSLGEPGKLSRLRGGWLYLALVLLGWCAGRVGGGW